MEVSINFSCRIDLEGDSLEEIKEKFDEMPIFCVEALDAGADITGVDGIFENGVEITGKWNRI